MYGALFFPLFLLPLDLKFAALPVHIQRWKFSRNFDYNFGSKKEELFSLAHTVYMSTQPAGLGRKNMPLEHWASKLVGK